MEKFLFVPYFCNNEYKNEALKNAKTEKDKADVEEKYGIYRRFICRPAVNGMVDAYLSGKNPLTVKKGELYDAIMKSLSNKRINIWVEKIDEPKKEVTPVEEPKQEEPAETVEASVETEPIEETPKAATPKKKKSTKKAE